MTPASHARLDQRFVVIPGAPKAGTSSLFLYLSLHPSIVGSEEKEPDYFLPPDYDYRPGPRYGRDPLSAYAAQFGNIRADQCGLDGSASYFHSPAALHAIAATLPHARLIVCLREPVSRLKSFYRMLRPYMPQSGRISFDAYVEDMFALRALGVPRNHYFHGLEHGLYADSMRLAFELFGRDRVHLVWFDRLERDTRAEVTAVARFIGIDPDFFATRPLLPQLEMRETDSRWAPRVYLGVKRTVHAAARRSPSTLRLLRRLKARWDTPITRAMTRAPDRVEAAADTVVRLADFYRQDGENLSALLGVRPYWINNPGS